MAINTTQRMTSIVFIDGSLADLQAILSGLEPSATATVLDPAQDGIRQMADALAGVSGLEAIHIISHGSSGQINLGSTQLTQDTLAQYQNQLTTIGNALSATGDLLLYGCNVARGDVGQASSRRLPTQRVRMWRHQRIGLGIPDGVDTGGLKQQMVRFR